MTRNLSQADWKMLRVIVRAENPASGRTIRNVDFTRKTKDGTFLADLMERGLIECCNAHSDPFKAEYVLTDLGGHAAEYGEYDDSLSPWGILTREQELAATEDDD